MIRIAISGAEGRMGRALYNAVQCSNDYTVVFGVDTFKQDDLPYPVLYFSFGNRGGKAP